MVVVVIHCDNVVVVVVKSGCSGVDVAVAMETAISSIEHCQLHQLSLLEFIFILGLQQ